MNVDRIASDRTLQRWQKAEDHRDQLQAQVCRLDADPRINMDDRLRDSLDDAITDADQEIEAAELAYWRSEGNHEKVRELEMAPFERALILADLWAPPDFESDED